MENIFIITIQENIQYILLFLTSLTSFIIAFYIYKNKQKEKSSRYFSYASVAIGFWVASRAILYITTNQSIADLLAYFLFIPTTFIVLFLFYFSLYLGQEKRHISNKIHISVLSLWFLLFLIAAVPGLVSKGAIISNSGTREIIYGPLFRLFYVPIMSLFLLSYFPIIINTYRKSAENIKIKIRYVLFGMGISILSALVANLILPSILSETSFVLLGPLTASVLVVTVGYAISREELWNFKLFITETIIYAIILFLLVDIFVSEGDFGITMFKTFNLVLMIIFSIYLIKGIFKEFRDKERIEKLTTNLSIANKRLQEIDVEKSEFVSIATHQLRTPLTIIKGYASMLLEGTFGEIENPTHKEIIKKIFDASQRLVAMIEDFLNISQIEKGGLSYKFNPIDIKNLIKEVVDEFSESAGDDVYVNIILEKDGDYNAIADELKLRQVFTNLLDNALKYSPNSNSIDVILSNDEESIIIKVRDYGIGIPKDALPTLFHKFSRRKEASKLHKEGRGLGLYVAKQIILAHNGKIWAESDGHGKGSKFIVQIPKMRGDNDRHEIKEFVKSIKT